MFIKKRGQTIHEYIVLLALVAAAFIAMQVYVKRGVQGRLKDMANQINSKQYEPTDTTSTTTIDRTGSSTEGEHLGTYTISGSDTTTTGYNSTTVEE